MGSLEPLKPMAGGACRALPTSARLRVKSVGTGRNIAEQEPPSWAGVARSARFEVPVKFELVINPAWLPVLDLDPVSETTRAIR